ncbi:AAC-rich mRNA clone AAC4 protein-like, partial [Anneissia japonica]|uniref:AAC-rich mRNA clone AAC4 protein-like n=1 Tax=Anneissia japonica TaxID=1529436 RepID=UPI001425A972
CTGDNNRRIQRRFPTAFLNTGLPGRRRSSRKVGIIAKKNTNHVKTREIQHAKKHIETTPSYNVYIGKNFGVRLCDYFKFLRSIEQASERALVQCSFNCFRSFASMELSSSAKKLQTCPNAGGNSVESEVLSFELLHRCFGAELLKTEMEVDYFPTGGAITDYTCRLFGTTLGVSVTRAMKYRGQFDVEDAKRLLTKKLNGILNATQNTLEDWKKQVLHIWAPSHSVAKTVWKVYEDMIHTDIKANTVVMVTITESTSAYCSMFDNRKKRTIGG